ncbi:MAG: hypothetical protein RLZZ267_1304 [Bacillota bacterium]|jgi:YggT family protein/cell division inhibitor SepF
MIIGYILLSWVPSARDSAIGRLLAKLVEPYLGVFRRFIPPIGGVIDLSPIVALFALRFIVSGLETVLNYILP